MNDLALKLRSVVGGDAGSNDGSRDTAGAAKGDLGRNKDVGNVLVLAQERKMQDNLDGRSVGSHDDELGDTTVQGLGGLVSALLQLTKVGGLLDEIEDLVGQLGISEREGTGVGGRHC